MKAAKENVFFKEFEDHSHELFPMKINKFHSQFEVNSTKTRLNKTSFHSTNLRNFQVFCRIRPLTIKERDFSEKNNKRESILRKVGRDSLELLSVDLKSKTNKNFYFDSIFEENEPTQNVFRKSVLSNIDGVLEGYNCTVFAYGMTGAGKSFTMFGNLQEQEMHIDKDPGIVLLSVKELCRKIERLEQQEKKLFNLKISYLEIYNEQVRDLLVESSDNLNIVEDPDRGVLVQNLTEIELDSADTVIEVIRLGNTRRTTAETNANRFSSRSHAIILIYIESRSFANTAKNEVSFAKLCLVDLAGSERASATLNTGIRFAEGANINKSLLALGNCINSLSKKNSETNTNYVPYRDSKLTRLLKESLGGNAKTCMMACVSQGSMSYEETLNTLKYASRAKGIEKKLNRNVKEVELDMLPRQYREEIVNLRNEIRNLKSQMSCSLQTSRPSIKEEVPKIQELLNTKKANSIVTDLLSNEKQEELSKYTFEMKIEMQEISREILLVIEKQWEITKICEDLLEEEQRIKDQIKEKQKSIKGWSVDPELKMQVLKEIELLQIDFDKTSKEKSENQVKLQRNQAEKAKLQNKLMQIHEKNNTKLMADLQLACRILNIEKISLENRNSEMKKNEEKIKRDKENQMTQMIEMIQKMKQILKEKVNF